MKIIPTQRYLLVCLHDQPSDTKIALPDGAERECYGEVLLAGPDCQFVKSGDLVLFMPQTTVIGFDRGTTEERYIVSEGSIFATCDPEATQSDATS